MWRTVRDWFTGAPGEETRRDNDGEELPNDDALQATEEAVPTIEQDNDSDVRSPNTAVSGYSPGAATPPTARERRRSPPFRTSPYGQRSIRPAAASPVSPVEPNSPEIVQFEEIPHLLAEAAPTYHRPPQPDGALPPPGGGEMDPQDPEQQAWDGVLGVQYVDEIREAIQDYLGVASPEHFLARISDIHGEDEMTTRARFARRYADDLPAVNHNGDLNLENYVTMLQRLLLDEIDIPTRSMGEAVRLWQDIARRIQRPDVGQARMPLHFDLIRREIVDYLSRFGLELWFHAFRTTHGDEEAYRNDIEGFFYVDDVTVREELLRPNLEHHNREHIAGRIVAWTRDPQRPLQPSEHRSRRPDWDNETLSERVSLPERHDFTDPRLLTPEQSDHSIRREFHANPGTFRWGRLYARVLRNIDLFGAEATLQEWSFALPDSLRETVREGAHHILRQGYMQRGEESLAALMADWLTEARSKRAFPDYLRRRRINAREEPQVLRPELVTAASRDRVQRRLDRAYARVLRRDERVADLEAELEEMQEDTDFLRVELAIARNELEEARASRSQSDAYGSNRSPAGAPQETDRERSSSRSPRRPASPRDGQSEDAAPTTPPQRRRSRVSESSADELYKPATPPRGRSTRSGSGEGRKRQRSASTDGRVASRTPPGRRRRVAIGVAIPTATTTAPAPAPQSGQARAALAPSSRVTRSKAKDGGVTFESMP